MDGGSADATAAEEATAAETIGRTTWLAIGAMSLAVFVIANDFTAMNVVLPDIEADFDSTLSTVQWVISGYALIFGVLIVPGGRLADLYGRRRILTLGAILFAGFSAIGGLAPDIWILILARMLMGVGGAMMWPAILGLMYGLLPASRSALAGGIIIGVAGIGNASGPVIAGALAEIDWRLIYFLNLPIALIAIVAVWRYVDDDTAPTDDSIDYLGTALLSISLLAFLVALTVAPNDGYTAPLVLVGFAVTVVAGILFILRDRAAGASALIPTGVLGVRPFVWACAATLAMSPVFFAVLLYLPQYFQKVFAEGTLLVGVMLLPLVGMLAVASFSESWLSRTIGLKAVITIGAGCMFVGPLLLVALIGPSGSFVSVVPGMVVLGCGIGLFYSSVTTSALDAMPEEQSSLAGGLLYMCQIAGGSVGLALSTSVFLAASSNEIDEASNEVGVTLSSSELIDIQGVLVGTETSQELLASFPSQTAQLTQIVSDAMVVGLRWVFSFNALTCLIGFAIAAFLVGGPLSRFGRDQK